MEKKEIEEGGNRERQTLTSCTFIIGHLNTFNWCTLYCEKPPVIIIYMPPKATHKPFSWFPLYSEYLHFFNSINIIDKESKNR